MARQKLPDEEIARKAGDLKGWQTDGGKLSKSFKFENFTDALDFVDKVGVIAEIRDHHPDIKFGWGYAEFEITTHDAGGLTENDFDLAKSIDAI